MNFVFARIIIPLGAALTAGIILVAQKSGSGIREYAGAEAERHASGAASPRPSVAIGGVPVMVEIATTTAAVRKGLSGRPELGPDQGMLFIFPVADRWRFWMPDMRFPIDIIWIAGNKVIDIDENVSGRFDPAHPVFFTPDQPVRHVLEVNAGFSKKRGIGVGDEVIFNSIP